MTTSPDPSPPAELPELPAAAWPGPSAALAAGAGLEDSSRHRYEIERELGRGGMGTVYLARRLGEVERRVAIKLLRPHAAGPGDVERRFRLERRILARLEHPNIARFLDAGTTRDGVPFVVMEHVEGERLDRWCEARGLDVEARLRLFLGVCEAVQFAHRNLVVHRDVKPGNVLVTADGVPKLLDFGIAKLLEPDGVDAAETRVGHAPLTPRYASPEQVKGEPVTTASDVYSLGVVLYELLAGRGPYPETHHPLQLARAVCEDEPIRPSTAATTVGGRLGGQRGARRRHERRALRGDLDHVVLRCLRKDPAGRYASAGELADELRRYLAGLPVEARRGSRAYRARKFVARHRLAVGAAAALVVLLAAFAVATRFQLAETRRQRDRAERVTELLTAVFEAAGPEVGGVDLTARELIDRGAARVVDLDAEPEVQASLSRVLGTVYQQIGDPEAALPHLERARALYAGPARGSALVRADVLRELANAEADRGKLAEAEAMLRESLAVVRREAGERSTETAGGLNDLAVHLWKQGRLAEAEAMHRDALALRRELLPEDDPAVAQSHSNLGAVLGDLGRYEEAAESHRRAVAVLRRGRDRHTLANALNNLGLVLQELARYDEAEAVLGEAATVTEQAVGRRSVLYTIVRNNLGIVRFRRGDLDGAIADWQAVVVAREELLGADHPLTASAVGNVGFALLRRGRLDEAERHLERSLAQQLAADAEETPSAVVAVRNLGLLALARGELDDAEARLADARERARRVLGEDHDLVPRLGADLADVHLARGDLAAAEALYAEARARLEARFPDGHVYLAPALAGLAEVHRRRGDPATAAELLRRRLDLLSAGLPAGHPDLAAARGDLERASGG